MYSNQSVQAIVGAGNTNPGALNTSYGMTPEGAIYSLTQPQQSQSNNQYLEAYHKITSNNLQQSTNQNAMNNAGYHHQNQQHHQNITMSLEQQSNTSILSPINNNRLKINTQTIDNINNISNLNNSFQQRLSTPTYAINKASPATVRWLLENYETAEGVSLPRSLLYFHYLKHCSEQKIDAINAASFGKLIRSVFVGLKTRRLGTRGNSKYHYYGIRLNPSSPLAQISYEDCINNRFNYPVSYNSSTNSSTNNHTNNWNKRSRTSVNEGNYSNWWQDGLSTNSTPNWNSSNTFNTNAPKNSQDINPSANTCFLQYIGNISEGLPDFPDIDLLSLAEDLKDKTLYDATIDEIQIFADMYRDHCETLLETVGGLQFQFVEKCFMDFWSGQVNNQTSGSNDDVANILTTECPEENDKMINDTISSTKIDNANDDDIKLTKSRVSVVVSIPSVLNFIHDADFALYQKFVSILLPDVMRAIPGGLTQAIRTFAKNLEGWLMAHLQNMPSQLIKTKLIAVRSLAQALRRYTSLNHLSQAARAVLHNQQQVYQMLADINRVDFNHVIEQAQWVCSCQCENKTQIMSLVESFKTILMKPNIKLDDWCQWLEEVLKKYVSVDDIIEYTEDKTSMPKSESNQNNLTEKNECDLYSEVTDVKESSIQSITDERNMDVITDINKIEWNQKENQNADLCETNEPNMEEFQLENKSPSKCNENLGRNSNENKIALDDKSSDKIIRKCKKFLMSWSFYGSLVIRDLTLRSAASFGSFHLIRLLFDEYLFYLVETKLSYLFDRFQLLILADELLNSSTPV